MRPHIVSMMHTGTRTLHELGNRNGKNYASVRHVSDPHPQYPIVWGCPVDIPIRDPIATAISYMHQKTPQHLGGYNRLYEWATKYPNVNPIKMEDIEYRLEGTTTPDYFGLRERFVFGDEPFPEEILRFMNSDTRKWLRETYGYRV